jgi:chaperonin GroEL
MIWLEQLTSGVLTRGSQATAFQIRSAGESAERSNSTCRLGSGYTRAEFEVRSDREKWGKPIVCNDRATITKEVELEDPEEILGARMIREDAKQTGDTVGDGTTTSALLAHAISSEGVCNVTAGASAIDLKRGLDRGLRAAVQALQEISKPVTNRTEKAHVATISAHNELVIGEVVADAVENVGKDGVIAVEEAKTTETVLEVVQGMQIDRGYLSPYFVSDTGKMEAVLEDPFVLLTEKKISSMNDPLSLLEQIAKASRPLLVIAEDVDGEALATLVVNRIRGTLPSAAVKAPGYGNRRRAMLEDIAILTGGGVLAEELGIKEENLKLDDLGKAKRVEIDKEKTTLIEGGGAKKAIGGHCKEIRKQIEDSTWDYDREKFLERLAKLSRVAVIRVSAPSETELKNRKETFDDAISATKATMTKGTVSGGGLALLRAIDAVSLGEKNSDSDESTGLLILKRALEAPTRQIAENSAVDGGVVVDRMRSGSGNFLALTPPKASTRTRLRRESLTEPRSFAQHSKMPFP